MKSEEDWVFEVTLDSECCPDVQITVAATIAADAEKLAWRVAESAHGLPVVAVRLLNRRVVEDPS